MSSVKKCKNCNKENEKSAKTCAGCGAKQKNTGKTPEPKVEVDSRELREISAKIGILIEILERIESNLNGGF